MELAQNEREINPIHTWVNGSEIQMQILRLDNFYGYNFENFGGYVHYLLVNYVETPQMDENGDPVVDGNGDPVYTITKTPLLDGRVELPEALVQSWGANDQPIFDYVALQLNLILI